MGTQHTYTAKRLTLYCAWSRNRLILLIKQQLNKRQFHFCITCITFLASVVSAIENLRKLPHYFWYYITLCIRYKQQKCSQQVALYFLQWNVKQIRGYVSVCRILCKLDVHIQINSTIIVQHRALTLWNGMNVCYKYY